MTFGVFGCYDVFDVIDEKKISLCIYVWMFLLVFFLTLLLVWLVVFSFPLRFLVCSSECAIQLQLPTLVSLVPSFHHL